MLLSNMLIVLCQDFHIEIQDYHLQLDLTYQTAQHFPENKESN